MFPMLSEMITAIYFTTNTSSNENKLCYRCVHCVIIHKAVQFHAMWWQIMAVTSTFNFFQRDFHEDMNDAKFYSNSKIFE